MAALAEAGLTISPTGALQSLRDRVEALRFAIEDIDAHSTPMGTTDDGFADPEGGYLISVGSLHRALGLTRNGWSEDMTWSAAGGDTTRPDTQGTSE